MNDSILVSIQLLLYAGLWLIAARVLGRERPAVWHWFGYCVISAVAVELVGRQKLHPELLITVAMDFSVMFGLVLARRGVELFMQVKPGDREFLLLSAVALVGLFWIGPTAEAKPHRVAFVCLVTAVTVIGGIVSCRAAMLQEFGRLATAAANVPALGMALMLLLTLAGALLHPASVNQPSAQAELAKWVVTLVSAGVFNFLFVFLVAARLLRDLRHQARHDPLTGLLNRRAVTELLEAEWARQQRSGVGFTLLAVDVDHFKRINDHHGHAAGDHVLREVAQVLRQLVRRIDHVGRMGGEEFLVLMPECDPVLEGHLAAERLRRVLAERQIGGPAGPTVQITASWGVAGTRSGDHGPDDALRRADAALYAAKEAGRNRVKLSA